MDKKKKQASKKEFSKALVRLIFLSYFLNIICCFIRSFMQDAPSPIALEPCSGNRAAVLSLLVRLPTGNFLPFFFIATNCTIHLDVSIDK